MNRIIFNFENYDNLVMGYSAKLNVSGVLKFSYLGTNYDTIASDLRESIKEYVKDNPHYDFKNFDGLKDYVEQNVAGVKVEDVVIAEVTREVVKNQEDGTYKPADQNALDLLHADGTIYEMGYTTLPKIEGRRESVEFHFPAENLKQIKEVINSQEMEMSL